VKRSNLDLPPEIAPRVLRARRWSGPPTEATERMRARLGWAFIETSPSKVIYTPERQQLREVPALRSDQTLSPPAGNRIGGRAQTPSPAATEACPLKDSLFPLWERAGVRRPVAERFSTERWFRTAARAAAALIVAHVPLALASLGVAIAAVPVTRIVLTRTAESRANVHKNRRIERRHGIAAPPASPGIEAPPPSPALLVVPSLAPLPKSFLAQQPAPIEPQSFSSPRNLPSASPTVSTRVDLRKDLALAAERQYLERARRSLVLADPVGALADLSEHRALYPDSQLSEEREALTVEALLRSGRVGEARLRADELRRRFPRSLLLPALDAALSTNR
jgi:hypothetical protein